MVEGDYSQELIAVAHTSLEAAKSEEVERLEALKGSVRDELNFFIYGQEEDAKGNSIVSDTMLPLSPNCLNLGEEDFLELPPAERRAYEEALIEEIYGTTDWRIITSKMYKQYVFDTGEAVVVLETDHGDNKYVHLIFEPLENGTRKRYWMVGPKDMVVSYPLPEWFKKLK